MMRKDLVTLLMMKCESRSYFSSWSSGNCKNIGLLNKFLQRQNRLNSVNRNFSSTSPCLKLKRLPIPGFVDFVQLNTSGGGGGQGLPKYGGFGGNGGNVVVMASSKVKTLRKVWQKYPVLHCKAGLGENSNKFHLLGKNGQDLLILVPHGVLVHKSNGEVVDLNMEGDKCVVALGGSGGNDKTNFLGMKGESNLTGLELKLLADVGLVGFPNAGKSTLLRAISKATPKVAPLPFTTISPQLGIMEFKDGRKISVADLPGLIEGAHQNFGMGFKFLRHAERTKLLLYVLDVNRFQLSDKYPERSAFETLVLLIKELEEYGHGMLDKPSILAINKIDTDKYGKRVQRLLRLVNDLPNSLENIDESLRPKQVPKFDDILTISARKMENVESVMQSVRRVMDVHAERRLQEELEMEEQISRVRDVMERKSEDGQIQGRATSNLV